MAAIQAAAARLLDAWERGQDQHPLHRALTLLRLGEDEATIDALAALPIGERDRRLIRLRASLFGGAIEALAHCPACGETLEAVLNAGDLASPGPAATGAELVLGTRRLTIRLPDTTDLIAAAEASTAERTALLLERCTGERLVGEEATAAEARMAEIDPLAEVDLRFDCPGCGHGWSELFDIASYLWIEVGDRAQRLLGEVDALARAYGWGEGEILALSARRRQAYLQLAAG